MKIPVEKELLDMALLALIDSYDYVSHQVAELSREYDQYPAQSRWATRDAASQKLGAHTAAISSIRQALNQEIVPITCPCGDAYPPDSYGAGFIAAAGCCPNCDGEIQTIRKQARTEQHPHQDEKTRALSAIKCRNIVINQ